MSLYFLPYEYRYMRYFGNGRVRSFVKAVWMVVFHGTVYNSPNKWLLRK